VQTNDFPRALSRLPLTRSIAAALLAGVVLSATLALAPGSFAATKTRKSATGQSAGKTGGPKTGGTKKSTSGAKTKQPATTPTPTKASLVATTLPAPRTARTPLIGWDTLRADEWPVPGDAVIAMATKGFVDVLRYPDTLEGPIRLIKGRSAFGDISLLALGGNEKYVRVEFPARPNGSVGWVRRSDVILVRTTFHILVDLDTNTLNVYDGSKLIVSTSVATGTGNTPTPTGLFFLKELVPQPKGGALGPYAFGLSGYSNVLTNFLGGEGTIGIHGTNAPGKLGKNVSHGCVRVSNDTIQKLASTLPLGTPVRIIGHGAKAPLRGVSSAWVESPGVEAAVEPGAVAQPGAAVVTVAPSATLPQNPVVAETTTTTKTTVAPLGPDDPFGAVIATTTIVR
jgi:L,D-transpeptidase catalytic domain